jgi:hypothetical protein
MSTNILLLGEFDSENQELITAIMREQPFVPETAGQYFGIHHQPFHRDMTYKERDVRITYNFLSYYLDVNNKDDEEDKEEILQIKSRNADVIIYSLAPTVDEDPRAFIERAKRAILKQKKFDVADAHARRIFVVTHSDNLKNGKIAAFKELKDFAASQGMEATHIVSDPMSDRSNIVLFRDIEANVTELNIPSRFMGYIFEALLGTVTNIIVNNPVAFLFNLIKGSRWNSPLKVAKNLARILTLPIGYPLLIIASALVINRSWHRGWLVGLETPYYVVKNGFNYNTIASFFVIGLATAAVLLTIGVFGPAVVGGIGLTALAVKGATLVAGYIGLSGSVAGIAVTAGAAAVVAGSILYGIGYGAYLGIKAGFNFIRSCFQSSTKYSLLHSTDGEADSRDQFPLTYIPTKPTLSAVPGAQVAAVPAPVAGQIPVVTMAPSSQPYLDPHAASHRHPPLVTPPSAASNADGQGHLSLQTFSTADVTRGSTTPSNP